LAESWQQPDPKTVVFKLRQGVKFHDGTDFNAEAARFNFNRMKTEPKSVRKGEVASIDTVDVVDAYTIKLNLKRPDAALLATLTDRAGMMVSPKTAQERGAELERNAKGAGTGPFEFVEWVKDDHILVKRNESYWNKSGGPYLDRIRYRPIPDDTVKLQSLQTGEIDVMDYVQPRDVAAVKADKNVVVVDVPSLADFAYQLNHTKPPFQTKALRQAVAYSLDLEQIVKGVWLNVGVPANGPIPPTSWAYDRSIAPIKRDLTRAKAKLAEGGQPNGFTFTMTTNNIPINVQEAEVIQAQLREAGITMKIKLVDSATLLSDGNGKNFEMISYQWSGRPDPDGNTYQFYKTTQGTSLNWSGISNPQIDALLDRSREVSSQAERKKLFSDLTKILQDELPMVFIVHPIEPKAFSPKVQGYEPIPDGMMRFKDVWLAWACVDRPRAADGPSRSAPAERDGPRPDPRHGRRVPPAPSDPRRSDRRHDGGVGRRGREGESSAPAWARPAAVRSIRGLDGPSAEGRSRPLDPQRRAGHREREPPAPSESRARVLRDDDLAGGRLSARGRVGDPPQHVGRSSGRDVRAVRHLHADLPAGPAPDLLLRRHPALAADLRLHGPARGAVERHPVAGAAGDHARPGARRRRHAHVALEPARGAGRGLRAHRARQGPVRAPGHLEPRAEERADPGRHGAGTPAGHPDRRRRDHGIRLRAARGRALGGRRGLRARLSAGPGGRVADRPRLHPEQPGRRRPLWVDRSPDPIWLTARRRSRARPMRRLASCAGGCCAARRAPDWRRSAPRSSRWPYCSRWRHRWWRPTIRSPRISARRCRRRGASTRSAPTTSDATCSRG